MGRVFIILGIVLLVIGIGMTWSDKFTFFGKLPGDIRIEKENFSFYFPVTTSILISVILTLLFYVVRYFSK